MDIIEATKKFKQLVELHELTIAAREKAIATADSFVHILDFDYTRQITAAEDFEDPIDRQRRGLSSLLAVALAAMIFDNRDVAALISLLDPASKYLGYEDPEVWKLAMRIGQLFDPKNQ